MPKEEAKQKVQELIEKYEKVKASHSTSKYTEEETKKDFIQPLFQILGWDTTDKNEVTAEEVQSGGRIDYGFYLNGRLKFNVEAKSLKTDLNREDYANQAVKYSWNKGAIWAILTDFENLKVFNAQVIDRSLADKQYFDISYDKYIERFDQFWLLSKEAFIENLLDKEAEKVGKKLQTVSVGSLLYKDLNECRNILTDVLDKCNPGLNKDDLDEGVQKLLDRLIFLRVAEDRNIEGPILKELLREHEEKGGRKFQSMIKKFRGLDAIYNSNLFSEHPFEKWEEFGDATEKVIKILYGKPGYYEYDFKVMPADVLGGVYENYLGYRLEKSKKGLSVSKDAKKRKEHGIYYTPDFIVDYIVKNTLKPVLDKCASIEQLKKIKVLDPACGSGSFLIKALEVIYEKYREFNVPEGVYTKIQILQENIYGVDLDQQAVEIARLNLLINALDTKMKLPGLEKNIKNGNSLISGTDDELKKYFGKDFRDKKPFNWEEEFPEVFKQGGFDVIIGNPPYIRVQTLDKEDAKYFSNYYKSAVSNYDIYLLFIEKGYELINKNGYFGMILPSKFLQADYGEGIRDLLTHNKAVKKIVDFGDYQIFEDATTYTNILFLQKIQNEKVEYLNAGKYFGVNHDFAIDEQKIEKSIIDYKSLEKGYWVFSNSDEQNLLKKIKSNNQILNDITTKIFQGLITGSDKIFILRKINDKYLSEATGKEYQLEDGLLHPLLKGSKHIRKYFIASSDKYILFPYKYINNKAILITQEELKDKYPDIWSYLNENRLTLENRENGKWKTEKWYSFSRNQNMNEMNTAKILTPSISNENAFTIDDKGEYYFVGSGGGGGGGYGLLLKDKNISSYLIISLLNSRLLNFYLKHISSKFQGGYFAYSKQYIKDLPMVIPTNGEVLVDYSKKMISLYKDLEKAIRNSDKWKYIESEIERTNKKIDEEVYKLYGLTEKEIEIVEQV